MFKISATPTDPISFALAQLDDLKSERTEVTPKTEPPYRPFTDIPAPSTPLYTPYSDEPEPELPYEPYKGL